MIIYFAFTLYAENVINTIEYIRSNDYKGMILISWKTLSIGYRDGQRDKQKTDRHVTLYR